MITLLGALKVAAAIFLVSVFALFVSLRLVLFLIGFGDVVVFVF